jgi:alpha-L-fucosidase 2
MGGCAGMAEMLLQSHTGTIELLPALPSTWNSGSVTGLKARGGYEVSMVWKEGKLYKAEIKAHKAGHCKIYYIDKLLSKEMDAGEKWVLKF